MDERGERAEASEDSIGGPLSSEEERGFRGAGRSGWSRSWNSARRRASAVEDGSERLRRGMEPGADRAARKAELENGLRPTGFSQARRAIGEGGRPPPAGLWPGSPKRCEGGRHQSEISIPPVASNWRDGAMCNSCAILIPHDNPMIGKSFREVSTSRSHSAL